MMMELFDYMLSRLPGITVLLLLLVAVRHWVLKFLNARIAYGMWLLVPLYLLLPFDWLMSSSHAAEGIFTYRFNPLSHEYAVIKSSLSTHQFKWLGFIWIAGALIYLATFWTKYLVVKSTFNANQLYQFKNVTTVNSSLIDFPAVIGFIDAYLILPKSFDQLSQNKQEMIINHELCHLRRQDFRWNIFRVLVRAVFWFHPLVHFADKYVEADQEISCDLIALESASPGERYQYGEALVESATHARNALLSQWDYFSLTKERVKMLKKYQQKQWHGIAAVVVASFALWFSGNFAVASSVKAEQVQPATIVNPSYPRAAAKAGIEGYVKFQMDVDSKGTPSNIQIIESQPANTFDEAALTAIQQWTFDVNKAQRGVKYTMQFKLQ